MKPVSPALGVSDLIEPATSPGAFLTLDLESEGPIELNIFGMSISVQGAAYGSLTSNLSPESA
jgi:hypothetical protein